MRPGHVPDPILKILNVSYIISTNQASTYLAVICLKNEYSRTQQLHWLQLGVRKTDTSPLRIYRREDQVSQPSFIQPATLNECWLS